MSLNIDNDEPPTLVEVEDTELATPQDELPSNDEKVPITIVTGYLGSGSKTSVRIKLLLLPSASV